MDRSSKSWLRIAGGKLLYITYKFEGWDGGVHHFHAWPGDYGRTFSPEGISSVEHGLARFLQEIEEDYGTR